MEQNWINYKDDFGKKIAEDISNEFENQKKKLKLEKPSKEVMQVFNKALKMVYKFLKKNDIEIEELPDNFFNIFVAKGLKEDAIHNPFLDHIVIDEKLLQDKQSMLETFIHEIYHSISLNVATVEKYKIFFEKKEHNVLSSKNGYHSNYYLIDNDIKNSITENTRKRELFQALNEGFTELLTIMTLKANVTRHSYSDEVNMILNIIKNSYKEGAEIIKFTQEYFSGGMMHLRKIEKFYGKKSLKMLAYLQTEDVYLEIYGENKKMLKKALKFRKKVIEFFNTKDKDKRENLRKNILKEFST